MKRVMKNLAFASLLVFSMIPMGCSREEAIVQGEQGCSDGQQATDTDGSVVQCVDGTWQKVAP